MSLDDLKEITRMQNTIERLKRELDTERHRNLELERDYARLRALLNAQDEYAYEDNGYVRLDTREDFHKVIGDGD